jgi:hypothetical protein
MMIRYQLTQPMSQSGDSVGVFRNTFTGEETTSLEIIPIKVRQTRVKKAEEYGRPLQGASSDGTKAISAFADETKPLHPDQECRSCPLYSNNKWAHNNGKCQPQWVIYCYRPATHEVVELTVKRTSYVVGTYLRQPHILKRRVVNLVVGENLGRQGKYYQILPRPKGFLSEEEQEFIEELAAQFSPEIEPVE